MLKIAIPNNLPTYALRRLKRDWTKANI